MSVVLTSRRGKCHYSFLIIYFWHYSQKKNQTGLLYVSFETLVNFEITFFLFKTLLQSLCQVWWGQLLNCELIMLEKEKNRKGWLVGWMGKKSSYFLSSFRVLIKKMIRIVKEMIFFFVSSSVSNLVFWGWTCSRRKEWWIKFHIKNWVYFLYSYAQSHFTKGHMTTPFFNYMFFFVCSISNVFEDRQEKKLSSYVNDPAQSGK